MLTCLLAVVLGQNLLTNGDFEQELTVGWTASQYSGAYVAIDRDASLQPDPDYEARDSLYGYGWAKLAQVVDVPGVTVGLDFWARFEIAGTSTTCWPVACVTVGYLDAASTRLGETRIYYHNSYCTWTPTSTLSLIEVTSPDWTEYELNVADELSQHLPGIDPGAVAKLEVALYDTTAGG
jgi:hypothetical protein